MFRVHFVLVIFVYRSYNSGYEESSDSSSGDSNSLSYSIENPVKDSVDCMESPPVPTKVNDEPLKEDLNNEKSPTSVNAIVGILANTDNSAVSESNPELNSDEDQQNPETLDDMLWTIKEDQPNVNINSDYLMEKKDQENAISTDKSVHEITSSLEVNEEQHNAYFYVDSSDSESENEDDPSIGKDQPNNILVVSNIGNPNSSLQVNISAGDFENELDPNTKTTEDQLPPSNSKDESNNETSETTVNVKIELKHDGYEADISTADAETEVDPEMTSQVVLQNCQFKVPNCPQGSNSTTNDQPFEDCAMR